MFRQQRQSFSILLRRCLLPVAHQHCPGRTRNPQWRKRQNCSPVNSFRHKSGHRTNAYDASPANTRHLSARPEGTIRSNGMSFSAGCNRFAVLNAESACHRAAAAESGQSGSDKSDDRFPDRPRFRRGPGKNDFARVAGAKSSRRPASTFRDTLGFHPAGSPNRSQSATDNADSEGQPSIFAQPDRDGSSRRHQHPGQRRLRRSGRSRFTAPHRRGDCRFATRVEPLDDNQRRRLSGNSTQLRTAGTAIVVLAGLDHAARTARRSRSSIRLENRRG